MDEAQLITLFFLPITWGIIIGILFGISCLFKDEREGIKHVLRGAVYRFIIALIITEIILLIIFSLV
jgi:hypothetical protein